jgi:hypothetical protein
LSILWRGIMSERQADAPHEDDDEEETGGRRATAPAVRRSGHQLH